MDKIKVGIIGGAGYAGGELIRLLLNHPFTELMYVHSRSHAGNRIASVHTDLLGDTEQLFTDTLSDQVDLVFLCLGAGESKKMIHQIPGHIKVIDLSQDFRIDTATERSFVYGLPELNRDDL